MGAFIRTSNPYTLDPQRLPRVIEVRPNALTKAPVDGIFEIDTTVFDNPVFRSEVACVADEGCTINYLITSELDGNMQGESGDLVVAGRAPSEVTFDLQRAQNLVIHLNLNSPMNAQGSRFLWIDPRVVEAL